MKESFLSGISNANNQSCPGLAICLCYFCSVVTLRYIRDPRTRYSTFAVAHITGFKIIHRNVRGIFSKHHLLESFINKTESKIDVIWLSEAHIKDGDNNSLYILYLCIFTAK